MNEAKLSLDVEFSDEYSEAKKGCLYCIKIYQQAYTPAKRETLSRTDD